MNTLTSIQHSSDRSAALAPLVAGFYDEAPAALRVRMLREMLRPVGPLALVAIAAGAFSRLLPHEPSQGIEVTPETASHIGGEQVLELARYVEQKAPELLGQLPSAVGDNPAWMASVSGALLLLALNKADGERPH